jgi:hypothetical protein
MELTWLYALATFFTAATMQQPFPLPAAVGTFLLASLSVRTHWLPVKGWRIVYVALFQLIGFTLAAITVIYHFSDGRSSFIGTRWLWAFFQQHRDPMEWIIFIFIGLLIIMFWISGMGFGRRRLSYSSVCRRFDLGVTAFLGLFLIRLMLVYKGGIQVHDPISTILVLPFFIFGLLALGMVNQKRIDTISFLSGFQGAGVFMGFAVMAVGIGTAVALLLLPYLTMAAEAGYSALKTTSAPLGPMIVAVLRFLLGFNRQRLDSPKMSTGGGESSVQGVLGESSGPGLFSWVLIIFVGIFILVLAAVGLWRLLIWLKVQFRFPSSSGTAFGWWMAKARQVWAYLMGRWKWVKGLLHGHVRASQLFGALVRWGRVSGVAQQTAETPLEYGVRLGALFPELHREIDIIVKGYHQEVYRESPLSGEQFDHAKSAWRRVRHPRFWPRRFRVGFLGGG